MNVSVFGLGYVGCVSAACMANDGNTVIGVDVNPDKVSAVGEGRSPIIEPGLDELLAKAVGSGRLCATQNARAAVMNTDISVVCVGTPSNGNGSLKLDYVVRVCEEIGVALAEKQGYHTVVIRSTVLPGTVRNVALPILMEHSGKQAGRDFGLAMNPEFLRESSAIRDYYHPSLIVIGEFDARSGDDVAALYRSIDAEEVRLDLEAAEMVKYVNNAFHAMKVVFANEVGNLAKAHGIDGRTVMDVVCRDKRLNISPAYLKPGNAFGGSCLPKDVRALGYRAKEYDVETPLLSSLLPSNRLQIEKSIRLVEQTGRRKIAVLGLSFKADTDDVRESPTITLIETLVGRGYQIRVYDEHVQIDLLTGANKSFLEAELPHIASLMRNSLQDAVNGAEVVVIANGGKTYRQLVGRLQSDQILIDLVGVVEPGHVPNERYDGICW